MAIKQKQKVWLDYVANTNFERGRWKLQKNSKGFKYYRENIFFCFVLFFCSYFFIQNIPFIKYLGLAKCFFMFLQKNSKKKKKKKLQSET